MRRHPVRKWIVGHPEASCVKFGVPVKGHEGVRWTWNFTPLK